MKCDEPETGEDHTLGVWVDGTASMSAEPVTARMTLHT